MGRVSLWVVLVVAGLSAASQVPAPAQAAEWMGFLFAPIATLGNPAPAGGEFVFDFEPWTLNERGEVAFLADLTTGGEGVFVARAGKIVEIARSGGTAPGGGTFEGSGLAETSINNRGDVVFPFTLSPFSLPFGVNAGLYRSIHATGTLEALVVPFVTPAPAGGTFSGVSFRSTHNDENLREDNENYRGNNEDEEGDDIVVAFAGLVPSELGIRVPGEQYVGLAEGVYAVDSRGRISALVVPGDPAPGGGVFDYAGLPAVNNRGDVAFDGHVAGDECINLAALGRPQAVEIHCLAGVYLFGGATGKIRPIARAGDPAPGGGTLRFASNPQINGRGDIAFFGDLSPAPEFFVDRAIFLFSFSHGAIMPIVRPGDAMPGGGHAVGTFLRPLNYALSERGDVSFHAVLDTDVNGDGFPDTGLYVWSRGTVRLVARTGTAIPGLGVVGHVNAQGFVGTPFPGGAQGINAQGQVAVQVTLEDGRGVLLLATPLW